MRRMLACLLCLGLCLVFQDRWSRYVDEGPGDEGTGGPITSPGAYEALQLEAIGLPVLAILPLDPSLPFPAAIPWGSWHQLIDQPYSRGLRQDVVANLACAPWFSFPANLSWPGLQRLSAEGINTLDYILHNDPVLFLQMSLERTEREVEGYSGIFRKRECLLGKLQPAEKIAFHFREKPYSIYMHWLQGARRVERTLYVEGENKELVLARPAGFLRAIGVVAKDPEGREARRESRYTLKEFGMRIGMKRTLDGMIAAQQNQALFVTYHGICELPEAGNRPCYKFVRTPFVPPAEEGLNELTLYIDTQTWLQVGSILRNSEGKLIGEYYFSDLKLNNSPPAEQFQRGAL